MKTYTLEELRLAQAKGCRIQMQLLDESWVTPDETLQEIFSHHMPLRIHPADEWKARLPRLKEGSEWHRNDFTNEMLEGGYRPLLLGELWIKGDQIMRTKGVWHEAGKNEWGSEDLLGAVADAETVPCRTNRLVPPEFLHPDELAKHEAAQAPDFGEPWHPSYSKGSEDKKNEWVFEARSNDYRTRIIACVNALRGVPDPAEFVRQAKEMREAIKLAHEAFAKFLAENDSDLGAIDTSPTASCPICTHGVTPAKFDKGPCPYHAALVANSDLKKFLP